MWKKSRGKSWKEADTRVIEDGTEKEKWWMLEL